MKRILLIIALLSCAVGVLSGCDDDHRRHGGGHRGGGYHGGHHGGHGHHGH